MLTPLVPFGTWSFTMNMSFQIIKANMSSQISNGDIEHGWIKIFGAFCRRRVAMLCRLWEKNPWPTTTKAALKQKNKKRYL